MSQQNLKQKLKEIQEQKQEIQNKKDLLEQLEKELIETEKLYQESLEQEIQKQKNTIELSQFIDSKIAEFEEKENELNLTKLKFKHNKDKRSLQLIYIDQNDNEESIFYIHDYSYNIKSDIMNMLDFHVKNIEIYNQLIKELPKNIINDIEFYYNQNIIAILKEPNQVSHSINLTKDLNNIEIKSWIDIFDIDLFKLKFDNNLKLDTKLCKGPDYNTQTAIDIQLSRTSIVQLKDIAKQINKDMLDLNYQINNNFTINYQ